MCEGEWSAIGKRCALAGVQRAREKEKTLKTWFETWLAAANVGNDDVLAEAAAVLPSQPSLSTRRFEIPNIRILPHLPMLTTLSMAAASIKPDMYPALIAEFEARWAEGVAQLAITRARL
ncbi:uncharacterized protein LACBIDRAFT_301328 [Laccaria bicolor S238N-H82]|uniref:Predicted protein n=1 Tax=Laccaria bicolor (strain S238N-H82 / ATCC MYA-4686) TaxID=486041 RepID=B0CNA3_LACBS|nr:uncharacterized protein LACBIDRAFT_301328 [Laccaria bicolor S238N-H82]EDR15269.1 predicted protein [Laccaria bicolor S238N-H82]|eukprot:XP_001873477.1 predicted protein [Laccaria bicolor S238N-H82]